MQTRLNETRFTTTDTDRAMGMFLARHIEKTTYEDMLDRSTGEITTIERVTRLMDRGTRITPDTAMTINFHLQTGDITEFEVTDQQRLGHFRDGYSAEPWLVTATLGGKNRKFILYARGLEQALVIAKDYIELNFATWFSFAAVKSFANCIALTDNFRRDGAESDLKRPVSDGGSADDNSAEGRFYILNLKVSGSDDSEYNQTFLAFDTDAESAREHAEEWIQARRNERVDNGQLRPEEAPFTTTITTATVINCYCVIPPDFSRAYFTCELVTPDGGETDQTDTDNP